MQSTVWTKSVRRAREFIRLLWTHVARVPSHHPPAKIYYCGPHAHGRREEGSWVWAFGGTSSYPALLLLANGNNRNAPFALTRSVPGPSLAWSRGDHSNVCSLAGTMIFPSLWQCYRSQSSNRFLLPTNYPLSMSWEWRHRNLNLSHPTINKTYYRFWCFWLYLLQCLLILVSFNWDLRDYISTADKVVDDFWNFFQEKKINVH